MRRAKSSGRGEFCTASIVVDRGGWLYRFTVSGQAYPYERATHSDPPAGGYAEDIRVEEVEPEGAVGNEAPALTDEEMRLTKHEEDEASERLVWEATNGEGRSDHRG